MDFTARLSLPFILGQQALKHVTHNEALLALDALVQPVAVSRSLSAPPDSPVEGETYVVGPSPSGAWAGHAAEIAVWRAGAWAFHDPAEGWQVYVADSRELCVFQDGGWVVLAGNGPEGVPQLGVNAEADAVNRLAVAAEASLFTHDGAGHRLTLNKATGADTASLVYQCDWTGHAEMGLTGDTHFHIKVSPDGTGWTEALAIDNADGAARFAGPVLPAADDAVALGASGARWSAVWAATGTIQTSDAREKADIVPSELGLDFILALQPVRYRFRNGRRSHYGLVAQQVEAVLAGRDFGGLVLADPGDPESGRGLRYEEFIAPLIAAVQALAARLDRLSA